jgi:hypothetical protein
MPRYDTVGATFAVAEHLLCRGSKPTMPRLRALILLPLATLSATAFAANANQARPGTLNYVEGQASVASQSLNAQSIGKAELQPGQTLETGNGRAEILLTPGVFLRVDHDSSVRMISPDLTHIEIALDRGHAEVEADQIYKQNDILIDENQVHTKLLKKGVYDFNTKTVDVRVFDGKAAVLGNGQKPITVKGGHELAVNGDEVKPEKFDKKAAEGALYNWSSLRSQYLGEANVQLASEYAGTAGLASGWFWDPYFAGYTWLPGDGLFWSPFGYGFYSPYYIYGGGYIYGGRGIYRHRATYGHTVGSHVSTGRPSVGFARGGTMGHAGGFGEGGLHGGHR